MPTKTYHWKFILFIFSLFALFFSYHLALDGFTNIAKALCIIPIFLAFCFILVFWPELLREIRDQPRRIIFFYLSNYLVMIIMFALIYYILIHAGESFYCRSIDKTIPNLCLSPDKTIPNLINFLYFSMITATTVGYGEYYPVTTYAKIITLLEPFITAVFLFTAFSIFVSEKIEPVEVDIREL